MGRPVDPRQLNVGALARASGVLEGVVALVALERLAAGVTSAGDPDAGAVRWRLHGRLVPVPGAASQVWLDVEADARVTLTCQRCLKPVDVDLTVRRPFRFVATRQLAEQEDADSDEDVLTLEERLDAIELVEDELVMAIPMVPMHDTCEPPLPLATLSSPPDDPPKKQPFAALAALKKQ